MAHELVYTSAARGLRDGTSGFCTVAMTRGLPLTLVPRLETLGGYRPGPAGDGPVALSFWRLESGQGVLNVLTRVGPAAPDHTQRSNKIASYLVLGSEELTEAGPAWLLQRAPLRPEWVGPPRWLEQPVALPTAPATGPAPCQAWARAAGDAGWAGVLVSAFLRDMSKPAHVIYPAGMDPMPLILEAQQLLPAWARWRATFSTYFLQPVAGAPCLWRFCLDGTPAADAARASKGVVIDLTRQLGEAPDGRYVRAARSGSLEGEAPATAQAGAAAPRGSRSGGAAFDEEEPQGGFAEGPNAGRLMDEHGEPIGLAPLESAASSRSRRLKSSTDQGSGPTFRLSPAVIGAIAGAGTLALVVVVAVLFSRGSGQTPQQPDEADLPGQAQPSGQAARQGKAPPKGLPWPPKEPGQRQQVVVQTPEPAPVEPQPVGTQSVQPQPVEPQPDKPSPSEPLTGGAQPTAPTQPAEPAQPVAPTQPAQQPTQPAQPALVPAPAPDRPSRQVVMRLVENADTLFASVQLNQLWGITGARFVPPPLLQQQGVVAEDNQLRMPGVHPSAVVELKDGGIRISFPVRGNGLEALASVIRMRTSAKPTDYARAVLRRVPLLLTDANGVVVATARVEAEPRVELRRNAQQAQLPLAVRELAIRAAVVHDTPQGREELDSREIMPGQSLPLKGRHGDLLVTFENAYSLAVTPESASAAAAEQARLADEMQKISARLGAVAVLQRKLKGVSTVTDTDVARAITEVQNALNDDEKEHTKDAKGKAQPLTDTETLQRVLPRFEARCKLEAETTRTALLEAQKRSRTTADDKLRVEFYGTDGMLLGVVLPEGKS